MWSLGLLGWPGGGSVPVELIMWFKFETSTADFSFSFFGCEVLHNYYLDKVFSKDVR